MEDSMIENREVKFGVEDANISKGYEIYRKIRFVAKNICIWGFVIILGVLQAYEDDASFAKYEDMVKTVFVILFFTAVILVGLYLLVDSCLIIVGRKFKCKVELSGTVEVEDVIRIEEEGVTSYEYHLGIRYLYEDTYYVFRFVTMSSEKDAYKDEDRLSVFIHPKDPTYLIIEKDNIKTSGCVIKGIIGGILLAPFALLGTLLLLIQILEGVVFVLERIQDMLV